jgi:hypothetical protein
VGGCCCTPCWSSGGDSSDLTSAAPLAQVLRPLLATVARNGDHPSVLRHTMWLLRCVAPGCAQQARRWCTASVGALFLAGGCVPLLRSNLSRPQPQSDDLVSAVPIIAGAWPLFSPCPALLCLGPCQGRAHSACGYWRTTCCMTGPTHVCLIHVAVLWHTEAHTATYTRIGTLGSVLMHGWHGPNANYPLAGVCLVRLCMPCPVPACSAQRCWWQRGRIWRWPRTPAGR